jgi:splicing factor 1
MNNAIRYVLELLQLFFLVLKLICFIVAAMEKETGAKIIIRGKGSVKEGKVGKPLPGEDEPLHAYVTGNSMESIRKAVDRIKKIIKEAVEVPEDQNDLRKMQLRELAMLNGTFREGEFGPRCSNCGATTHKVNGPVNDLLMFGKA